MKSRGTI